MSCVAVAEGGNQTIVSVGVAVCVGIGVSVGCARFTGRHAANVIARRSEATTIAKHPERKQSPGQDRLFRVLIPE
jgi:hypothetical protein